MAPPKKPRPHKQDGLPTREKIMAFIASSDQPAGKREIGKAFGLHGADKIALKALLKDMADEGLIDIGPGRAFHKMGGVPRVTVLRIVDIDGNQPIAVALCEPDPFEGDAELAGEELGIAPSYLIVPASLEQTAYQLTSSNYVPARQADVNEFRSGGRTSLEPIVEPLLDGNSTTAWYLAASNAQVDTVEYCYLDGAEGPVIETEVGFESDGVSYKCREDFAAKAIEHRGLYKAAGG